MNAYTTTGQARIQPRDMSVLRANGLAGASIAALEQQRGWQAESNVEWLLTQNGIEPHANTSFISALRQTVGAALIRAGERLVGVPWSAVSPEMTLATSTLCVAGQPSQIKEPTMTTPPQRSVLHKIAARRSRLGRPAAHPMGGSVVTGSAPQSGTPARIATRGGPRRLTHRELEVLHLVACGETDQGIADRLYLSRRTISCHVGNILAKLQVPSRTAAAITAARIGLL
jgi:DNA-binding CsgD family transcriptional regulator